MDVFKTKLSCRHWHILMVTLSFILFSVRPFVGSAWSFGFSPPQRSMTSDFEGFSIPLHLFSYLNSWERASILPSECSLLNKGTTGTSFITSLAWRGPWRGIEPGTSRTRSQRYTTRLSVLVTLETQQLIISYSNWVVCL